MPAVSSRWFGIAGAACALGLGALAYRTARIELPAAVRDGIARRLAIPVSSVTLRDVHIGREGLVLEELAAGQLGARRVIYRPSMAALFGAPAQGRLEVHSLVLEDPSLGVPTGLVDRILVDRAEVELTRQGLRARAQGVRVELVSSAMGALPDLYMEALGLELARVEGAVSLHRAAFTGLELGPIKGLAGSLHRREELLELRAAGEGALLTAHLSSQGGDATLELTRRGLSWDEPSAPLLARLGLPRGRTSVSGRLAAHAPRGVPVGVAHFSVKLDLEGTISVPRLAAVPVPLAGSRLEAHGQLSGGVLASTMLLTRGAATLEVTARLDPTTRSTEGAGATEAAEDEDEQDAARTLVVDLSLPSQGCEGLLAALPSALRPALEGMQLEGTVAASVHATLPLGTPRALKLDGSIDNACRVLGEPPLADASRLRAEAPLLVDARDEHGRPRRVELGPANPGFRRLDQLPNAVIDTFVEAEDGRFFRHHGLDVAQIRRALAYDLEVGAPGRGGSTITQQLAKNLFLSGDRTLGRKLEEVALAWRLEEQLGKRRILELYLNLVELGPGTYGVAEGARRWIHKDVSQLSVDEAAMLAALLPAPRRGLDSAFHRRYAQLRARLPGTRSLGQAHGVAAVQAPPTR